MVIGTFVSFVIWWIDMHSGGWNSGAAGLLVFNRSYVVDVDIASCTSSPYNLLGDFYGYHAAYM
jgi:hypothetical protein